MSKLHKNSKGYRSITRVQMVRNKDVDGTLHSYTHASHDRAAKKQFESLHQFLHHLRGNPHEFTDFWGAQVEHIVF